MLLTAITLHTSIVPPFKDTGGNTEPRGAIADMTCTPYTLVCILLELGSLVRDLRSTAAPLLHDTGIGQ